MVRSIVDGTTDLKAEQVRDDALRDKIKRQLSPDGLHMAPPTKSVKPKKLHEKRDVVAQSSDTDSVQFIASSFDRADRAHMRQVYQSVENLHGIRPAPLLEVDETNQDSTSVAPVFMKHHQSGSRLPAISTQFGTDSDEMTPIVPSSNRNLMSHDWLNVIGTPPSLMSPKHSDQLSKFQTPRLQHQDSISQILNRSQPETTRTSTLIQNQKSQFDKLAAAQAIQEKQIKKYQKTLRAIDDPDLQVRSVYDLVTQA